MSRLPSSDTHRLSPGGRVVRKATVNGTGVVPGVEAEESPFNFRQGVTRCNGLQRVDP